MTANDPKRTLLREGLLNEITSTISEA
jgi:hypothetical protein